MSYAPLGSRRVQAAADSTGNNTGNWTSVLGPSELAITVPVFELYRAVAKGVRPGDTADIFIDGNETSYNIFGSGGEWDPNQPPLLQPGQTMYFYWSTPTTVTTPPVLTAWFRYDASMWSK